jgi:Asp-tRNA(Asn)/Glu-tRNA(Gln) amidotransferase A subunit family amidase
MDRADIPYISATGLSHLLRKKEVSAVEAVEAYLERIEALDDKLNAFLTVCHDEALEAAREADQAMARGNYLGPRHGIPVAVKDQLYTKGVPTTLGSPLFKDFIPDEMPL